MKPAILVDKVYALGRDNDEQTQLQFSGFVTLHEKIPQPQDIAEARNLERILEFLRSGIAKRKEMTTGGEPKPADIIAYRCGNIFQHDLPWARTFWKHFLESELCGSEHVPCSLCGNRGPVLRILPFSLKLFDQTCPIMAVNTDQQKSFGSRGKEQLQNAPVCLTCAGSAHQVLQLLVRYGERGIGPNAVVIARDDSPSRSQPLRNQLAVFWTKIGSPLNASGSNSETADDDHLVTGPEAATRLTFGYQNLLDTGPPPEDAQMSTLLSVPWVAKSEARLQFDAFNFAVLSPNKSRLVLREWMELDIEQVQNHIGEYVASARIMHPDGIGVWFPPVPALLDALHAPKSDGRLDDRRSNDPHLFRALLRCVFRGEPPPRDADTSGAPVSNSRSPDRRLQAAGFAADESRRLPKTCAYTWTNKRGPTFYGNT